MTKIQSIMQRAYSKIQKITMSLPRTAADTAQTVSKTHASANDCFVHVKVPVKESKPIAAEDVQIIRTYLMSKKLDVNVTQQEFNDIQIYEGIEFDAKARDLLLRKMNIPKELAPDIVYTGDVPAAAMLYNFLTNQIFINNKMSLPDKLTRLCAMRHELQHFMQNMLVLRHEALGDRLVQYYLHMTKETSLANLDKMVRTFDMNQLKNTINDPASIFHILGLRTLIQTNRKDEYRRALNAVVEAQEPLFRDMLNDLKNTAADKLGVVKEVSPESKRAEKFYAEITNSNNYWKEEGKDIDYGMYLSDCRENEALIAQDALRFRLIGGKCFPREVKKALNALINSESEIKDKLTKDVTNYMKTKQDKGEGWWKEYISYLYN